VGEAYDSLRREMVRALHEDPERIVAAPRLDRVVTAAEVVGADFSSKPDLLTEAIRIIAEQATSGNLRASAFIATIANRHAKFHCDDLARMMAVGEAA
jgi:hypothetical protein